ncbi:hypothetical protein CDIK_0998 [Cucumispora dikerogammari]|nr:hypothetical protein CDIK_0998 [Cucumispora dikerogammari]
MFLTTVSIIIITTLLVVNTSYIEENQYYLSPSLENSHIINLKNNILIEVPNINVEPTIFTIERYNDSITIKVQDRFICPLSDNLVGFCDSIDDNTLNNVNKKYWKLDKELTGIKLVNQNMCLSTGKVTGISVDAVAPIRPVRMSICPNSPEPTLSFDVFIKQPFVENVNYELLSKLAFGGKYGGGTQYRGKDNKEFDKLYERQKEKWFY